MTTSITPLSGMGRTVGAEMINAAYPKRIQGDTTVSQNADGDTVRLSLRDGLGNIGGIKLPSLETVRELSAELSGELGTLFRRLGIPSQPPVDIRFDYTTNEVKVTGDRTDTARIEKLLNNSENLKEQIRTLSAISSHAYRIQESIAFQQEYRASSNPRAVVAKYSYLFNSNRHVSVGLRYGGGVDVVVNGRVWNDVNQAADQMTAAAKDEAVDDALSTIMKREEPAAGE